MKLPVALLAAAAAGTNALRQGTSHSNGYTLYRNLDMGVLYVSFSLCAALRCCLGRTSVNIKDTQSAAMHRCHDGNVI